MTKKRTLLAVFSHPDDECVVAPVLARYARQGVHVHVVYATDGQLGVRAGFGVPAGPQLGAFRRKEAECASRELGLKSPIFLGLEDASLGAPTSPPGKALRELTTKLQQVLDDLGPKAIVTWGPDGGYGHPDHCLVQDAVTQLVQASATPYRLYYVAFAPEDIKSAKGPFAGFLATDSRYITVKVRFTDADLEAAQRSVSCHASQFSAETIDHLNRFLKVAWSGRVSFRPWFGEYRGNDLFQP